MFLQGMSDMSFVFFLVHSMMLCFHILCFFAGKTGAWSLKWLLQGILLFHVLVSVWDLVTLFYDLNVCGKHQTLSLAWYKWVSHRTKIWIPICWCWSQRLSALCFSEHIDWSLFTSFADFEMKVCIRIHHGNFFWDAFGWRGSYILLFTFEMERMRQRKIVKLVELYCTRNFVIIINSNLGWQSFFVSLIVWSYLWRLATYSLSLFMYTILEFYIFFLCLSR